MHRYPEASKELASQIEDQALREKALFEINQAINSPFDK